MSGFSPEWLRLREAADRRARNRDIESVVQARFAQRDAVTVVDLGCGTGSNLRATTSLLPNVQSWTLVDNDAALLDALHDRLPSLAGQLGGDWPPFRDQLMAILHDKIKIAKATNVQMISLKGAPKGYVDFDKGAAKKYVIDPHGMVKG